MRAVALALSLLASCSRLADELTRLPATDIFYVGGHNKDDVALAVLTWAVLFEARTGEAPHVDGTRIEERTLSEELDGYLSNTGTVVVAAKESISSMAVMHELTHQHLRRSTGDADADHAFGDGPWLAVHDDVIADATDTIRRCGL